MGAYNLPRHLRVTVGTPEENDLFLAALAASLGASPAQEAQS